jgi:phosphoribosylanthranilate isomerase
MDLITNVKVSAVNSLTDARFFSGAGVKYLGFCFDKNSERYIESEKVFQIKDWVSGPSMVGEFSTNSNPDEINLIIEKIGLDYVQMSDAFPLGLNSEIEKPIFQEIVIEELSDLYDLQARMDERSENVYAYVLNFLVHSYPWDVIELDPSNIDIIWKATDQHRVIIDTRINKENVLNILDRTKAHGVNIPAGNEISIGMQSFEDVADIFEVLERDV